MTLITGIRKTRQGRCALFGEEGFLFSVDALTLADAGLCEGDEIEDAELARLRERGDTRRAVAAAMRFLSRRAHGSDELYRKLLRSCDEHTAAAAVAEVEGLGLLDDDAFAQSAAREMTERGRSPREICQRLYALGLSRDTVAAAVAPYERGGAAIALRVIQKHYMDKLGRGEDEKVAAALARRGFSYGDIRSAVAAARGGEP